jgi:CheY-like chemotaxis protein
VEADPTRLAQVVANVLNNAAKYMEEGGQIWVAAQREDHQVAIRVRDTGIGIPAELVPHVFDLFTQASRSPERSQGGLGIGLSLARSLLALHGGTITACSEGPGRGSEFVVRLPIVVNREDGSTALKEPHPTVAPSPPRRVLVVDDNVDAAQCLAMLLEADGHHVGLAHDGPEALRVALAHRPEIVFLDIGLPEMDGYQVARHLRERPELANVVLVALTGYGQEQDRRRSREAGFDHHLVKPVEPAVLQDLLASAGWSQMQNLP